MRKPQVRTQYLRSLMPAFVVLVGALLLLGGCAKSTMTLEGDFGEGVTTESKVTGGPTVQLSSAASLVTNASFTVIITFSEAVAGFNSGGITVTNGSPGNFSTVVDGTTYTVDISPSNQGAVTVDVGAGVAFDSLGSANRAAQLTRTFDTVKPTVTISSDTSGTTKASPIPVTVAFGESVTGFLEGDLTVENGTISNFTGSGKTYTMNIVPTGQGLVTVDVGAGGAQDEAGNTNTAATRFSRTYDSVEPTVTLYSTAPAKTHLPIPVTVVFSEPVDDFTAVDVTVVNGSKSNFKTVSATEYTVDIAPIADGPVTVKVLAGAAHDAAGNGNPTATERGTVSTQLSRTFDSTLPTVSLRSDTNASTNISPIPVEIVFSEEVTGFDISDITVSNGTKADFAVALDTAEPNSVYSVNITPSGQGTVTVDIADAVTMDKADNPNTAAARLSRQYNITKPKPTLSSSVLTGSTNQSTITVTIAFDKAVSGFATEDVRVGNCTKGEVVKDPNSNSVYHIDVHPSSQDYFTVNVDAGAATDGAGNPSVAASELRLKYDIRSPAVSLSPLSAPATNASPIPVTIIFDENVTEFVKEDITVTKGTVSDLAGSGQTYFASIQPSGQDTVTVDVKAGVAKDEAGNTNTAAATALSRIYDSVRPAVSLSPLASAYTNQSPFTITVTFNEPVTGFTNADITVGNGTASDPQPGVPGVYTVGITPTDPGTVTVSLGEGIAQDSAGNLNTAAGTELSVEYDNSRPGVFIASEASEFTRFAPIPMTFTFTEPVTGFSKGDITLGNGTIPDGTDVVNADAGIGKVYKVDVTPSGQGEVKVDLAADVVQDQAGNTNTMATQLVRKYDTGRPAPTISSGAFDPPVGSYIDVSINFNEDVKEFTIGDVSVQNGVASNFTAISLNLYQVRVTPTNGNSTVRVNVLENVAQDEAGNLNLAGTEISRTFNFPQPTVTLESGVASYTTISPIPITIAFSADVTGYFDAGDITVGNGSVAAGSFSGTGTTYYASITPAADMGGTGQVKVTVDIDGGVAQDSLGNLNAAAAQLVRTYDTKAPAITLASGTAAPPAYTNSASIPVTITFDEKIKNFVQGDLIVTNGSIASFSGAGTTYNAVITPTAEAVKVEIAAGAVQDLAGNSNTTAVSISRNYDGAAPKVSSITRVSSDPTNSDTVQFKVLFTEEVKNVSANDFNLVPNGVSGASITGISASNGTSIDVTVDTGENDGTLRLDLIDRNTITDLAGNALAGVSTENGSYSSGQSYTIDKTAPSSPGININGGGEVTPVTSVDLALSAGDAAEMYITNAADCGTGESWVPYNTVRTGWLLGQASGTATVYVKFRDLAHNETSCVSDTIRASVASKLAISGPTKISKVSNCSTVYVAAAEDALGQPTTVTTDTQITLSGQGTGAFYEDADCSSPLSTGVITISRNTSSANFYFKDKNAETVTLKAQGGSLVEGSLGVEVTGTSVPTRVLLGGTDPVSVGSCTPGYSVTSVDDGGTAQPVLSDTVITLSTGDVSGAGDFYSDHLCQNQLGTISVAAGSSIAQNFYFKSTQAKDFVAAAQASAASGLVAGTLSIHAQDPVAVTGLVNDTTPTRSKTWKWGCNRASCKFRYVIDTFSNTLPSDGYGTTTMAGRSSGTGTYHIHVQAMDIADNSVSEVMHAWAVIDNTGPVAPTFGSIITTEAPFTASSPGIRGTSSADTYRVVFYGDSSCTGVVLGWGPKAEFEGAGIAVKVASGSITEIHAKAMDQAGNSSNCEFMTTNDARNCSVGATQIAVGSYHSCALMSTGKVWCWGDNSYGQLGNGGQYGIQEAPVEVSGVSGATAITAGGYFTCALLFDGTVKCWGDNSKGQLGNGSITSRQAMPVSVTGLTGATGLKAGYEVTCATFSDLSSKCWGDNTFGQFGNTSLIATTYAAPVSGVSGTSLLVLGKDHSCGKFTNAVKCWGRNDYGQLGTGDKNPSVAPVPVTGGLSGIKAVTAGNGFSCLVLSSDGSARCWGDNSSGALGYKAATPAPSSIPSPVPVRNVTPVLVSGMTELDAGQAQACARFSDGTAKCWGANQYGQLGIGSAVTSQSYAASVTGLVAGESVTSIKTGNGHTCALLSNGTVKCWGRSGSGQLGIPSVPGNTTAPTNAVAAISIFLFGTPTQLGFIRQPSLYSTVGIPFNPQPVVAVQDACGNLSNTGSYNVTLEASSNSDCSDTAVGTLSVTTNPAPVASGKAEFADVSYTDAIPSAIFLRAKSAGLGEACSQESFIDLPRQTITLVGATTSNTGASAISSLGISAPSYISGTGKGDLLLMALTARFASGDVTPPQGWRLIQSNYSGMTGSSIRQNIYIRVAGDNEIGPYSFVLGGGSALKASAVMLRYSGVDTTDPIEASDARVAVVTDTSVSTTITAPSVTVADTEAGSMLVTIFGVANDSFFTPTPMPSTTMQAASGGNSVSTRTRTGVFQTQLTNAGATGERYVTAASGADNIGQALVLRRGYQSTGNRLAISGPGVLNANTCSAWYSVTVRDGNDGVQSPPGTVSVTIADQGAGGSFYSSSDCSGVPISGSLPLTWPATTISFTYKKPSAGTVTLSARAENLVGGTQSVRVLESGAAAVLSVTKTNSSAARVGSCMEFGVSTNQKVNGTAAILSISGGGSSAVYKDSACSNLVNNLADPVTIPVGEQSAKFYAWDDVAEQLLIAASSPGMILGTLLVNVEPGGPAQVAIEGETSIQSGACRPYSITAKDAYGNAAILAAATSVALSNTGHGKYFAGTDTTCQGAAISSVEFPAGSASVTVYFSDLYVEPTTLLAMPADSGILRKGLQVTVTQSSSQSQLAFYKGYSPLPGDVPIYSDLVQPYSSDCHPYVIRHLDASGNPVSVGASPLTMTLKANATYLTVYSSVTYANGGYTCTGSTVKAGTLSISIPAGESGTVFGFVGTSNNGYAEVVTVTVEAASRNVSSAALDIVYRNSETSFTAAKQLAFSTDGINQVTRLAIEKMPHLDVNIGSGAASCQKLYVLLMKADLSGIVAVADVTADISLHLGGATGSGKYYLDSACTIEMPDYTFSIPKGTSNRTPAFYFKDDVAETVTLNAYGQWSIPLGGSVSPSAYLAYNSVSLSNSRLALSGRGNIGRGACSVFTVRSEDASGNPSSVAAGVGGIGVSDGSGSGVVYSDSKCRIPVALSAGKAVLDMTGLASKEFYYKDEVQEKVTLSASASGFAAGELNIAVISPVATDLAMGVSDACALVQDRVQCWGAAISGRLGDRSSIDRYQPGWIPSGDLSGVTGISSKSGHSCALLSDGSVKCWGSNSYGQLGLGYDGGGNPIASDQNYPVLVSGVSAVKAISVGAYHTCAVLNDGRGVCWGRNNYGQVGNGTVVGPVFVPTAVIETSESNVLSSISATDLFTCAVFDSGVSGTAKCWGNNHYGQAGDGSFDDGSGADNKLFPPESVIPGLTGVVTIVGGDRHACALLASGSVKCWGSNFFGQVGDGSGYSSAISMQLQPQDVVGLTEGVVMLAAGTVHTCALLYDGSVRCWGYNNEGELGDNSAPNKALVPVPVSGLSSGVVSIAAGAYSTCAKLMDGKLSCWGSNSSGQLGYPKATSAFYVPTAPFGLAP